MSDKLCNEIISKEFCIKLCSDIHAGLFEVRADVMRMILVARRERGDYATAYSGICAAFTAATGISSSNLVWGFVNWPKFSGNVCYPIPGESDKFEHESYGGRMWFGEYGALRLELLDFLIEFYGKVIDK